MLYKNEMLNGYLFKANDIKRQRIKFDKIERLYDKFCMYFHEGHTQVNYDYICKAYKCLYLMKELDINSPFIFQAYQKLKLIDKGLIPFGLDRYKDNFINFYKAK